MKNTVLDLYNIVPPALYSIYNVNKARNISISSNTGSLQNNYSLFYNSVSNSFEYLNIGSVINILTGPTGARGVQGPKGPKGLDATGIALGVNGSVLYNSGGRVLQGDSNLLYYGNKMYINTNTGYNSTINIGSGCTINIGSTYYGLGISPGVRVAGNIGVGTYNPLTSLDIYSTGTTMTGIFICEKNNVNGLCFGLRSNYSATGSTGAFLYIKDTSTGSINFNNGALIVYNSGIQFLNIGGGRSILSHHSTTTSPESSINASYQYIMFEGSLGSTINIKIYKMGSIVHFYMGFVMAFSVSSTNGITFSNFIIPSVCRPKRTMIFQLPCLNSPANYRKGTVLVIKVIPDGTILIFNSLDILNFNSTGGAISLNSSAGSTPGCNCYCLTWTTI